ncbi:hypothetical protein BC829DRAFT_383227, partial [Chytridium lagenaria]
RHWDGEVWAKILIQLNGDRDIANVSCVCKAAAEASNDAAKVLAPRLIRIHGRFLAIYNTYRTNPERLSLPDAYLPRYFEAQSELKRELLQDQIELRAKMLEEQRLEGERRLKRATESINAAEKPITSLDGEVAEAGPITNPQESAMNSETAMMPLPVTGTFSQNPHFPFASWYRLPQNLQWVGRLPENAQNPAFTWPPDDAAFFAFSWEGFGGIRDLILKYGLMPSLFIGPQADALAPWRTPGLDSFSPSQGTSSQSAGASLSISATYPWLPSEISAEVPENVLLDETVYWDLVNSNIQIAPSRYSPSLQSSEALIMKSLQHLPKELPSLEFIGETALAKLLGEPSNYGGMALNTADALISALGFAEDVVLRAFLATYDLDDNGDNTPVTSDSFEDVEDVMDSYWAEEAAPEDEDADKVNGASGMAKAAGHHRHMMTRQGRLTGTIQWTHWKWAVTRFGKAHVAAKACLHDFAMRETTEDPNAERRWQFAEKEANAAVRNLVDEGIEPAPVTIRRVAMRILRDAGRREEGWDFGYGPDGSVVPPRFVFLMAKVESMVLHLAGSRIKKLTINDAETTLDNGDVAAEGAEDVPPRPSQDSEGAVTTLQGETLSHIEPSATASVSSEPAQQLDPPFSPVAVPDSPLSEKGSDRLRSRATASVNESKSATHPVRSSPVPYGRPGGVEEEAEEPFREPSPLLQPWIQLLRASVIDNEQWKGVVTAYAQAVMVPLGGYHTGDPPEVRFYWATVTLVKDALDLNGEPEKLFAGWEADVCERLGMGAFGSGTLGNGPPGRRISAPPAALSVKSGTTTPPTQGSVDGSGGGLAKKTSAWELAWARWSSSLSSVSSQKN